MGASCPFNLPHFGNWWQSLWEGLSRNWYAIKLLDRHIWDGWIMNMILYTPRDMHSSQLTHICNNEVSLRPLQQAHHLQIKRFMPRCNPQGWMLEKYAWEDTCYREHWYDVVDKSSSIIIACLQLSLSHHFFLMNETRIQCISIEPNTKLRTIWSPNILGPK